MQSGKQRIERKLVSVALPCFVKVGGCWWWDWAVLTVDSQRGRGGQRLQIWILVEIFPNLLKLFPLWYAQEFELLSAPPHVVQSVSELLGRGRKLRYKDSEVRKLIIGIRVSLMCSDFIRLCWLYAGKVIQPLLISAIWADLVFVFIPPLLQWQGIKSLRQITGIIHQPLMKRFCLHVWVHLIRISKSKKSSNPPMSINPSSVISAVGTLFLSGELTFYLAKYSFGCCSHWFAVAHINCPWAEECLPGGLILS